MKYTEQQLEIARLRKELWAQDMKIKALNKAFSAVQKKLATDRARDLHLWCLGQIVEGPAPVARYLQILEVIEWYVRMDNVILDQNRLISRLKEYLALARGKIPGWETKRAHKLMQQINSHEKVQHLKTKIVKI